MLKYCINCSWLVTKTSRMKTYLKISLFFIFSPPNPSLPGCPVCLNDITCYLSVILWSPHLYPPVDRSSNAAYSTFKMSLESSTTHCYCLISYTLTSLWNPIAPAVPLTWELAHHLPHTPRPLSPFPEPLSCGKLHTVLSGLFSSSPLQ